MDGFIYLACPYSHPVKAVRELRVQQATWYASMLMRVGKPVFSPITHSHAVAEFLPGKELDHDFWMAMDLPILRKAAEMHVLTMEGWRTSRGVMAEMEFAFDHRIKVYGVDPNSFYATQLKRTRTKTSCTA